MTLRHVTLKERLWQAMKDAGVTPTDLARRLVAFRGGDPDNRNDWDAARGAIARWRNGRSKLIKSPEEARFLAETLGKPADFFMDSAPPSALLLELEELTQLVRDDPLVLGRSELAEDAILGLRAVADLTRQWAEALEALVEAARDGQREPPT